MGLFLSMVAVAGRDAATCRDALAELAGAGVVPPDEVRALKRLSASEGRAGATVLFDAPYFSAGDAVSAWLSRRLETAVLHVHVHDGDLWMLTAFVDGGPVTRFNPLPDYWEDLGADERASWAGDAEALAALVTGAEADAIRPYLVEWTEEALEQGGHARPEDEFERGDCWQFVDLLRALGFEYPDPPQPAPREPPGVHVRPAGEPPAAAPAEPARKKPWWRFW